MSGIASVEDVVRDIPGRDDDHKAITNGGGDMILDDPDVFQADGQIATPNGTLAKAIIEDEKPSRRQPVNLDQPSAPIKEIKRGPSPPWKAPTAEGPSSFTEGGRRKSGRTNAIPLELQPPSDKRQTRGAVQKTSSKRYGASRKSELEISQDLPTPSSHARRPLSAAKGDAQHGNKHSQAVSTSPKRPYKSSRHHEMSPESTKASKRPSKPGMTGRPGRPKKSTLPETPAEVTPKTNSLNASTPSSSNFQSSPRIRFRLKPPSLPLIHPGTVRRKPKLFPTAEEYIEKAWHIPLEAGGLVAPDDEPRYTEGAVKREAALVLRLEEAAEPGGILSEGICSAYGPEENDETYKALRQYSHRDHFIRAATGFRDLMVMEQRKHLRNAKRLAEACRDHWIKKQPKTQAQIEAEALKMVQLRYKTVLKSLQATWDNVRLEVNRQRLKEWEAEEQVRVRKALNEAVDLSTQKLEARRVLRDSEAPSSMVDDDESGSDNGDDEDGDSSMDDDVDSNMSSVDSGEDQDVEDMEVVEDENMTAEELRQKYANLPDLVTSLESDGEPEENGMPGRDEDTNLEEDSDESIDMDDDMGSSDEDSDDEDNSSEEDEDDEDEVGSGNGLLGFLAPSDRASIVKALPPTKPMVVEEDILDEEDEVSLIPAHDPADSIDYVEEMDVSKAEEDVIVDEIEDTAEQDDDVEMELANGEIDSESTPVTADTKMTEDSASSVELQQPSENVTRSATPQPAPKLKTPVPFLLRGTLRDYQHYGLDWLAGLYANNTNGILADEMGLGKTIQTIALLAHLACEHQVWGPHLVIVPTSVMLNWEMEFKKFCPGFKVLTYYGSQEERRRLRVGWLNDDAWNVIITSYQLVLQDAASFKKRRWHYMVLDEAHNIKNFRSKRWQTLLMFNTRARLLLTGTPLQNNLTELWSLLFFLMPSDGTEQGMEGFADLKEFSDWFRKPEAQILENGRETMDEEARAIIGKLHKVLRPYLLRRLKADVEKQMPGKYEHVEYCRLSRRQRELYDGFLARSDTRGTLASGNYLSIINCLMQLRKVCNHPDLFQERPILSSYPMKRSVVADFEIKDLLVRRRLLQKEPMETVSLEFLNLVPTRHEYLSGSMSERAAMLTAQRYLMDLREAQRVRAHIANVMLDQSTIKSNITYLDGAARWSRFEELQHVVYLNALRRQQRPIYGKQLVRMLDFGVNLRPLKGRPRERDRWVTWLEDSSSFLREMVPTLEQRSERLQSIIEKFACITPPIITPDARPLMVPRRVNSFFQTISNRNKMDAFHEARMRLSVQFPDKRLLQYDCGKLQTLAKLLRKLQSQGSRALIFTQMTKVLDILEQFLNIHGYKYLRLDGSTRVEQRQILTDRFNNDDRILVFILSSRSGGIGINLTGADTVIFYDLDWNPAMDKQCQDRCHRIGQTRDVHIYRLISEHTIEANILRKANQKRMLDDVVIQEGEFTTDGFNKAASAPTPVEDNTLMDGDAAASAAMDRVLGGPAGGDPVFQQAEDKEDVAALKVAEQEIQADDADFDEKQVNPTPKQGSGTPNGLLTPGASTPAPDSTVDGADVDTVMAGAHDEDELNADGQRIQSIDDYMLRIMTEQLRYTPLELPKDKNRSKWGKDHRNRSHRVR